MRIKDISKPVQNRENVLNILTTMGGKWKTVLGIFLFGAVIGSGCGSPADNPETGEGTVFDTVPVFEKDTFLYPLATRSSSYMFPEVNYGEVKAIDGDPKTAWQTLPGLVTGEYIEFDFDSLYISAIDIRIPDELRLARIKNLRIYLENQPIGTFPAKMRIPVGRKVNTLRIELGETDGINRIDIPFVSDSARPVLTESHGAESVYSSKAAAISEITFFNEKNVPIPVRSLPVKKARINAYGTVEPHSINNVRLMFDGRKAFGWKGPVAAEDRTILFSFDEDQIINGLYFPFTENLNVSKIGFRLRKRTLPEYTVVHRAGNGIFIPLKNTLKGKNFELVILETGDGKDPFIPELLFHDGSRLFSIYSDSMEVQQKLRLDSALNTPLKSFIDSRVTAFGSQKEYAHPLEVIFSPAKTVKDTLPIRTQDHRISFRLCSNGTFMTEETRNEQVTGNRPETLNLYRKAEGYWFTEYTGPDETGITCYAELRERQTRFPAGKAPMNSENVSIVTFDVSMMRNQIRFSGYFSGMTTGY